MNVDTLRRGDRRVVNDGRSRRPALMSAVGRPRSGVKLQAAPRAIYHPAHRGRYAWRQKESHLVQNNAIAYYVRRSYMPSASTSPSSLPRGLTYRAQVIDSLTNTVPHSFVYFQFVQVAPVNPQFRPTHEPESQRFDQLL